MDRFVELSSWLIRVTFNGRGGCTHCRVFMAVVNWEGDRGDTPRPAAACEL